MMMRRFPVLFLAMLLVLAASTASAAAPTVTLSPTTVSPGGTVTITITDLPDGSNFTLEISSDNLISSGAEWYNLTNFQMPFALKDGELKVVGGNVNSIFFEAKKGGVTQSMTKDGAGTVTVSETRDINQGTYDYIRVQGAVANPSAPASVALAFSGEKYGDDDSQFSFTIDGARSGTVAVAVIIDGAERLSQTITIVAPASPPPSSGSDSSPPPTATPTPAPVANLTGSDGRVPEAINIASSDGVAALAIDAGVQALDAAGTPLSAVTITPVDPSDVPPIPDGAAFAFAGYAYECRPDGATFDPAIVLAFTLTEEEWEGLDLAEWQTLAITWFNGATGQWEDLPTAVDPETRTVTAEITHFSTFALMATGEAPQETPIPTPTPMPETPTPTPVPPPEDEGLPLVPIILAIVLVVVVAAGLYYFSKRER